VLKCKKEYLLYFLSYSTENTPLILILKYTLPFFYTTIRHYALFLEILFGEGKKYLSCKYNTYGYISIQMKILIKIFNDSINP